MYNMYTISYYTISLYYIQKYDIIFILINNKAVFKIPKKKNLLSEVFEFIDSSRQRDDHKIRQMT